MPIKAKEIQTRRVFKRLICDECGEDDMHWTNTTLTVNPPLYPHVCSCGHISNERAIYPRVDEELAEDPSS